MPRPSVEVIVSPAGVVATLVPLVLVGDDARQCAVDVAEDQRIQGIERRGGRAAGDRPAAVGCVSGGDCW